MSSADCQLTAIREITELRQLRDLYRREWPAHCVGYYCLDNFIRWLEHEPEIKNLHIFTLNNDWRSQGLFLVVDRYQLFVNSLRGDEENVLLTKAISSLDWTRGYKVSSFLERHRAAVLSVVESSPLQQEYDSQTLMYYMPCEEASKLEVNCPQGYHVRSLGVTDADTIDDLWPNRHSGSLFLIKRLISWNANMGVYVDGSAELVAWCLRLQGGFLGALQVKDSHKRMGLGSLVARATSRRIGEMGHDVMALVNNYNEASRGMFSKLGFKVTETCYWLRAYSSLEALQWPEGQ